MRIALLYTPSELTPWKENVNERTLQFIAKHAPANTRPSIVEFCGFDANQLDHLRQFDLVFNLCYGFGDAGQVDVSDWLTENHITHTASSPKAMRLAQDKSLLPDLCQELGLLTPPLINSPEAVKCDQLYLRKPRFGSCHRLIDIGTGVFFTTHFSFQEVDFLIQPYIRGREFSVAVIPDRSFSNFESLPPVEIYPEEEREIFTAGSAFGKTRRSFQPDIAESLYHGLSSAALALHHRMQLSAMSRTDFRVDDRGFIYVLDVNALPNLDPELSLMPAICENAGIPISELISRTIYHTLHHKKSARITPWTKVNHAWPTERSVGVLPG